MRWVYWVLFWTIYSDGVVAQKYASLFNGTDLEGWHFVTGEDTAWRVENNILVGRHQNSESYDHLASDSIYDNFTLRFKFKWVMGNSGLFFRSGEAGWSGMSGLQVLTTGDNDAVGLWETHGRNWVIVPNDRLRSFYIPNQWNQWEIHAYGSHIVLFLNDSLVGDLPNDPGRTIGHFALKLHGGGAPAEVHIKDVLIADTTRLGCTDTLSINYDKWAFRDDGSCELVNIKMQTKSSRPSSQVVYRDRFGLGFLIEEKGRERTFGNVKGGLSKENN